MPPGAARTRSGSGISAAEKSVYVQYTANFLLHTEYRVIFLLFFVSQLDLI